MTDHISGGNVFPVVEVRQAKTVKREALKAKAHPVGKQVVLKCGDTFLITDACGDLHALPQELGLFQHGTRFLHTCNLYLEGHSLATLSHHVAPMGNSCHIDLTNAAFALEDETIVEQGTVHIARFLELEQDYLMQTFTVTNFHTTAVPLTLSLEVNADFYDSFEVRGWQREQRGTLCPIRQSKKELSLGYCGLDKVERTTRIQFEPAPDDMQSDRVDWVLNLQRGDSLQIRVKVEMAVSSTESLVTGPAVTLWRDQQNQPSVTTSDPFFNRLLERGMCDLMMLSTMTPQGYYPYAGIPWFSCPFGRDGLIAALEFLPFFPQVARGTLEFLAFYQGKKVEQFTDEEPGKILHEFRTGEMAHCNEIPFIPYYGTADATPLFIIALEEYMRWTNDVAFLERLWPNAEAAARWLIDYGDRDGDTFIEYHCASGKGLSNQGWKDAWDAVTHSDGRIARSPMALCEVQGYAYAAYCAMSRLARRLHKPREAALWKQVAATLQDNFLRHFWWEQEQTLYLGLDENKEQCAVVSSNAGQCLWTGIVPEDRASQVISRLMRNDMFSGWGMRTLSTQARRYNPMSYHNGSVWPHDTALVGAGFARYGAKEEAGQLLKSLFDASTHFELARLPELYCGFARRERFGPTRYPNACSPQAWASGSPFAVVSGLLGLQPNAEQHSLTLHQPTLPSWLKSLELRGISVGAYPVHLKFVRVGNGTKVIVGKENRVDVRIIQDIPALSMTRLAS